MRNSRAGIFSLMNQIGACSELSKAPRDSITSILKVVEKRLSNRDVDQYLGRDKNAARPGPLPILSVFSIGPLCASAKGAARIAHTCELGCFGSGRLENPAQAFDQR
jgi:hypothetical protein